MARPKYNPIVPSSLLSLNRKDSAVNSFLKNFNDVTIKTGMIVKSYEIDEKENIGKKCVEYNVMTMTQDKDLGSSLVIYKKCTCGQMFGGLGDFMEFRQREPNSDIKDKENPQLEDGSMVLLACINGFSDRGIIIGSVQHPGRATTLTKTNGIHLEGEFNGINWKINKDGELRVEFKSATDNKGKPSNSAAGGSFILFEKNGTVRLENGAGEKLHLHKDTKIASLEADKDIILTAGENIKVEAGKNVELTIGEDLLIEAAGNATIMVQKDMKIEVTKNVDFKAKLLKAEIDSAIQIKTKQVLVNTNILNLKGEQAIFLDSASQIKLTSPAILIGPSPTPAVTLSTIFLGVGNLGIPVISVAIGPFSSAVSLG